MTKKIKWLIIISVIIFIFDNILLCMLYFNQPVNEKTLYNNALEKTVEIRCTNDGVNYGYATGAVIAKNGTILTNKHVVMANEDYFDLIQVRFYNDSDFQDAHIVKVSESNDLALISIDKNVSSYFKLGKSVQGGEKIYTIGNPNGFGLSFSGGYISSPQRIVLYENTKINAIQTSIVINEGNSGGPLFNQKGELIGLISFRLRDSGGEVIQAVSFALHLDVIKNFLA